MAHCSYKPKIKETTWMRFLILRDGKCYLPLGAQWKNYSMSRRVAVSFFTTLNSDTRPPIKKNVDPKTICMAPHQHHICLKTRKLGRISMYKERIS